MSTGSLSQEDSCSTSSISSPESNSWSPCNDDSVFLQPISPTLPVIKTDSISSRLKQFEGDGSGKKERRRTQNINTAFADLRGCIPNVPTDTKLSKIKTLRLAISYIQHLMQQLNDERYHVVLGNSTEFPSFYQHTPSVGATERIMHNRRGMKRAHTDKMRGASQRKRGRTGWPEMVWALELNRWW